MALILILCVILPLMTTALECPNGTVVHRSCYNLSHVFDLHGDFRHEIIVNQLGVLRKDRTLYYSYEPELSDPVYNKIGFVNLKDPPQFGEIVGDIEDKVDYGCFDFDQAKDIIYLGSSNGVVKFNPYTGIFTPISSPGHTIISISFKDKVYFVRDNEFLISFKKGRDIKILLTDGEDKTPEEHLPKISVKKFVVANDNTVLFLTAKGLFVAKAEDDSKVYKLSDNAFFHGFARDVHGEVYTWWLDGIYKVVLDTINLAQSMVFKVADIYSIGALAFDNDNSILYTIQKSLYRLVKSDNGQC